MAMRKQLQYLFSPEIRKRIEQYDVDPREQMIERYSKRIKKFSWSRPCSDVRTPRR